MEKLLTVDEIKDMFHIGNTKVYQLCKQPSFPAFRVNNIWYVRPEDLNEWIEKIRKTPDKTYSLSCFTSNDISNESEIPNSELLEIYKILSGKDDD